VNNFPTFATEKKAREREECSIWNTILSHICSKSPELSLILACLSKKGDLQRKKKNARVAHRASLKIPGW
jgi:hypothetical protein